MPTRLQGTRPRSDTPRPRPKTWVSRPKNFVLKAKHHFTCKHGVTASKHCYSMLIIMTEYYAKSDHLGKSHYFHKNLHFVAKFLGLFATCFGIMGGGAKSFIFIAFLTMLSNFNQKSWNSINLSWDVLFPNPDTDCDPDCH